MGVEEVESKSWESFGSGSGTAGAILFGICTSILRMRIATGVEDYSTSFVEQSIIIVIGNKELWELVLMGQIFFVDLDLQTPEN